MTYQSRWYLCSIEDRSEIVEPDWSRVPEVKREQVRGNWLAKQQGEKAQCLLWGPQIAFFQKMPYYTVTVGEPQ